MKVPTSRGGVSLDQRALLDREDRFASTFTHAAIGMALVARDGSWLSVNPALCRIIGYSEAELLAATFQDITHPEDLEADLGYVEQMLSGEIETYQMEKRYFHRDGDIVWVLLSVSGVYDHEGRLTHFISQIQDITERKHAERRLAYREQQLELFVKYAPVAVAMVDADMNYLLASDRWYRDYDLVGREIVGRNHDDIFPETTRRWREIHRRCLAGATERGEDRLLLHRSGREEWKRWEIHPWRHPEGTIGGLVIFTEIITERKRIEDRIQHYTTELERSNRELQEFAYVASHDLQEPLRMVSSYLQLLDRRYRPQLDGQAQEFIGFAVEGSQRMKQLIHDLLVYSRVGSQGVNFDPTDTAEVVRKALENLRVSIEESDATVTWSSLPEVLGDESQLVRLFQNLIGNAVKFRGDAPPTVRISATESEDGWQFSVRDNGIGVDPEYAERIFTIFQRLHARRKYAGTGIGLAICRRIVERHGGRIWVEADRAEGSTFHFTIAKGGRSHGIETAAEHDRHPSG